jgi:hypothetical protein
METFYRLTTGVKIISEVNYNSVNKGIERFRRDVHMTLQESDEKGCSIHLKQEDVAAERYHIYFPEKDTLVIGASDELGFVYALLYISEKYLGVLPFWFWNDQKFQKKEYVLLPLKDYYSNQPKVRFRGWFINDEVLIDKWSIKGDAILPWEMALEALLRCGGNMVIPGTDHNSRKNRELAAQMGLWITHHHAEPLGAEMFARRYPDKVSSYYQYPELYRELWKEGIKEQRDKKVIWNLGFRGQGDRPFWADDPSYETAEARGALISSVIKEQYDLVAGLVKNPVCCTNLYGEIMELYREGHIKLPEDIIKIWADNGYGKMVSRRQGNENPRVYALPTSSDGEKEHHGLYYHVSFYDLQAANHMTMQPNSLDFIGRELEYAFEQGADDFIIVNCSNIKPHVYFMDAIRSIWHMGKIETEQQGKGYVNKYFSLEEETLIQKVYDCFDEYAKCTIPFGSHEDERAGEQFYNYTTRILMSSWLKGNMTGAKALHWATGDVSLEEQIIWYYKLCTKGYEMFSELLQKCNEVIELLPEGSRQLFEDSILLQIRQHVYCLEGALLFCDSFMEFKKAAYQKAFYCAGCASLKYLEADTAMKQREHDKWEGFYDNDCLCDFKQTAYMLKYIMGYIRNMGEGPHFYQWQREFLYKEEDRRVVLLTNNENHLTDEELFECMKGKI